MRRSLYTAIILEATKCPPEVAGAVEAIMRETYHTLDNIDRRTFFREARKALKVYEASDADMQAYFRGP